MQSSYEMLSQVLGSKAPFSLIYPNDDMFHVPLKITMDVNHRLPFKVGQLAESKSFIKGFRGAWFRCKIKEIGTRKRQTGYMLEFYDYPDDKEEWTKSYEKPQTHRTKSKGQKMELMVRPCFPPIYHENQMPDASSISEVVAIVDNVWKVGDLVDWWYTDCYWSAKITRILGEDKVQVELPKCPVGEGGSYEALCKDLRPSLDWSPEHGWTVPISKDGETCRYCARLLQPYQVIQNKSGAPLWRIGCFLAPTDKEREEEPTTGGEAYGIVPSVSSHSSAGFLSSDRSEHPPAEEAQRQPSEDLVCKETETNNTEMESKLEVVPSVSSHSSAGFLSSDRSEHPPAEETQRQPSEGLVCKETETNNTEMDSKLGDRSMEKASLSDSVSSSDKDVSAANKQTTVRARYSYTTSKRMRSSGKEYLNSTFSDTVESTILDLEELANKIKWLKGLLQSGFPLSNATRPSWKYFDNRELSQKDDGKNT
ncbi:PREDICTED: uncharacterized protein LOC104610075 isoform X3 [Nelumbo nucifera]|uniref:Uncharacterized protein LOC104610075 isoform X3 n=1 Tax=Nelumbo nucifera TaxID=4432 RepID=A0A1U8BEM8_NELNU|nr:PREDICTED: uncharacterized protein LOC104610075 isoform X3 [Nelumbo nucifera]XP_010274848.1 PREDICTED: uncharacterized protein LOC104610075 isoform X3 [Nelumbo nucifera]